MTRRENDSDEEAHGTISARFLSALTHELRTPLGSVLMLAEMLVDDARRGGDAAERKVTRARKVHLAALDMRDLIDQAATLARIESGRARVELAEVPVERLSGQLLRAAREHQALVRAPEVHLTSDVPETIVTDRRLLSQLVGSLVGDVIPDESEEVTITLSSTQAGADGATGLAIDVHHPDVVVGADQVELLFEPFQPGPASSGRRHGGQSLNLTIARAWCRRLGGSLEARRGPAGGLTFRLVLPLENA